MSTGRLSSSAKALRHFAALTPEQQHALVRKLGRTRTVDSIAAATRLSADQVREILGNSGCEAPLSKHAKNEL